MDGMSKGRNDGGPVFPSTEANGLNSGMPGMSLRQHYAGLAMQGLLASGALNNTYLTIGGLVYDALTVAEAMIEQENK